MSTLHYLLTEAWREMATKEHPMSTPREIAFDEIQVADLIEVRWWQGSTHWTRRGTVADKTHLVAFSPEGEYLVTRSFAGEVFLLARPAPEIPVGTTGTATVRGVEGVRVFRVPLEPVWGGNWISARPVGDGGEVNHDDSDVTDFVPDVLWTEELRGQLAYEVQVALYRNRTEDAVTAKRAALAAIGDFTPGPTNPRSNGLLKTVTDGCDGGA